jgi:hypothetical protein
MLNLYLASSVVSEKLLMGVPYYILSFGGTHVRFPILIMYHNLVFDRENGSLECVNRATRNNGQWQTVPVEYHIEGKTEAPDGGPILHFILWWDSC